MKELPKKILAVAVAVATLFVLLAAIGLTLWNGLAPVGHPRSPDLASGQKQGSSHTAIVTSHRDALPPADAETLRREAANTIPLATIKGSSSSKSALLPVPTKTISTKGVPLPVLSSVSRPSQIAASKAGVDPALVQWLTSWEQKILAGATPSDNDPELVSLLTRTSLSPADLCEIGNAVSFLARKPTAEGRASGDYAARLWYRQVFIRANELSSGVVRGSQEAIALVGTVQSVENPLWRLGDGKSLEIEANILMKLLPLDDPAMVTARTTYASSHYLQGRYEDALKEITSVAADSVGFVGISDEQKTEMGWVRALVLYSEAKFEEAIPLLQATADTKNYHHAKEAWPLLCYAEAECGRRSAAVATLARFSAVSDSNTATSRRVAEHLEYIFDRGVYTPTTLVPFTPKEIDIAN